MGAALTPALAAMALQLVMPMAAGAVSMPAPFQTQGGRLVDREGRERVFHGITAVRKVHPFVPDHSGFDPVWSLGPADAKNLSEWGMNAVRLGVLWAGTEPVRGEPNATYLEEVRRVVDNLWAEGVYTLVETHQDVGSDKFCGNGMPHWAAQPAAGVAAFPAPLPIVVRTDPETGAANMSDCRAAEAVFAKYYETYAANSVWQRLWTDDGALGEAFVQHWGRVADALADHPGVLGYEILNEPWPGDVRAHPALLLEGDTSALAPLYSRVAARIRRADPQRLIFFEGNLFSLYTPASRGFATPPAANNTVYAQHLYCGFQSDSPKPWPDEFVCKELKAELWRSAKDRARRMAPSVPVFLTEFNDGWPGEQSAESDDFEALMRLDGGQISWLWWQLKSYGEPMRWFPYMALYNETSGLLRERMLRRLARTYAPAIAAAPGTTTTQQFSPETAEFELQFTLAASAEVASPTVVSLNRALHYPAGFEVDVEPAGVVHVRTLEHPTRLELVASSAARPAGAARTRLTVRVRPKKTA